MKLVYLTAKKYPSNKTDPFYVRSMAGAFAQLLGNDFVFVVRGTVPEELRGHNAIGVAIPERMRTLSYFFYLPLLIAKKGWGSADTVFLSYDPNLLSILIFWRSVRGFKYRVVSDWHQLFGNWKDAYVARHSDKLTTTSQRLKNIISASCAVTPEKILPAYGGVDPRPFIEVAKIDRANLRASLGLPKDTFLVGYIGIFTSIGLSKGLDTMIEALPLVGPDVVMVFVGGYKQEIVEYRRLAKQLGVEERCVFVEKQPFEKVVEYERALDVLVIPYPDQPHFRDYGFPMKVWEYMAAGRPILYSNLEIMAEVLAGRATQFTPGDAASFAQALAKVRLEYQKAEAVAAQNRTDVQAYTWEARARHIVDFIHS